MSEAKKEVTRNKKVNPRNKQPTGLSERARVRLNGLSAALESPNTAQLYLAASRLGRKPTNAEKTQALMAKVTFLNLLIRQEKRARRAAKDLNTYAANQAR